ncbi:pancreatic secretory granule membrane major glycoprotein GP2-like isoform X2 [Orbicella faveolata]|uniref:pancreatic secretory granule membrane major glycoprotein GP2-like isoform X2 n=1 Tax=Orbicella faveolata TaxID=48498 RepID=UPI0009E50D19|nr:pancreatic secretory granule membrane major glycoprotein GP2-like isoform X2 [Orbicella faveolata]
MKLRRIVFMTFLVRACSFTTTPAPTTSDLTLSPECSNYKFLNESDRAQTYNKSSPVLCDATTQGWYRFGGGAGNQMPESCVNKGHCGTQGPGWLNGSHPSVDEGAVTLKVCFNWRSFCCLFETYITVRNCGGFFVYRLRPALICDSRYCGNGLTPTAETTERPTRGTTAIFSHLPTNLPTKEFSPIPWRPSLVTPQRK